MLQLRGPWRHHGVALLRTLRRSAPQRIMQTHLQTASVPFVALQSSWIRAVHTKPVKINGDKHKDNETIKQLRALADQKQWNAIAQKVYDCYRPLQQEIDTKHPLHQWMEEDSDLKSSGNKVVTYDDQYTKTIEQEALALCVTKQQPALAIAIYDYRRQFHQDDNSSHFRSYYSWAMGAFAMEKQHERVLEVFDAAMDAGIFPTASMNTSYAHALLALRAYDDIATFYQSVLQDNRPTNVYFYRQLLVMAARTKQHANVAYYALRDMHTRQYALRPVDTLHAIYAFEREYFDLTKYAKCKTYSDLDAILQTMEKENRKPFAKMQRAATTVIKLWQTTTQEQVVELAKQPKYTKTPLLPRLIVASVLARSYTDLETIMQMDEEAVEPRVLTMAMHGFLMAHQADKAQQLLQYQDKSWYQRLINLLTFLVDQKQTNELLRLLSEYNDKHKAVSKPLATQMLKCLVHDSQMTDETLWQFLEKDLCAWFPVQTDARWFAVFASACCDAKRHSLVHLVLQNAAFDGISLRFGRFLMQEFTNVHQLEAALDVYDAMEPTTRVQDPEIVKMASDACEQLEENDIRRERVLQELPDRRILQSGQ